MQANPYQQYRATVVETATPAQLVALLYQGVVRFTQRGLLALERRDLAAAHEAFVRAQAIVLELTSNLDFEQGGEIARNLASLYAFAYQRLLAANCRKEAAPAEQVVALFRTLLPAWQALAGEQVASAARPAAPVRP
ncbi:MAG TPA: flagellar export chaperone FliS [Chloroflexota bacterium]|jgi:flagellar protein FliS|nr:flagellar export chaperone FliS [Chloroflexota bacterium]